MSLSSSFPKVGENRAESLRSSICRCAKLFWSLRLDHVEDSSSVYSHHSRVSLFTHQHYYYPHLNMSGFPFNDYYDPEEAYYGYDNDEWHDDDNWYSNDGPEDVLGGDIYQNKNYSHGRLHRVGGQYAV